MTIQSTKFLPGIHGLRAIAALSVLLFHQSPNLAVPTWAAPIKLYGGLGVPLFFALSAFSLAHSTFHRMDGRGWVHGFAIRRFFRIAPLFYLGIALFLTYDYLVWGKVHNLTEIILNVLFLHGFVPGVHESIVWAGWTIGVEMIFYAVFPIILAIVGGVPSAFVFFLLSCVASGSANAELTAIPGISATYPYMNIVRSLPSFAAGLLAFHAYEAAIRYQFNQRAVQALCAILVAVLGYAAVNFYGPSHYLWSACFGVLCIWQAYAPGYVMGSKPMQFIGERSYSVYLIHAMVVFRLTPVYAAIYAALSFSNSTSYLVSVALGIACVLTLANITYTFIESPSIRFGARYLRPRAAPGSSIDLVHPSAEAAR